MRPQDTEGMEPVGSNGKPPIATTRNGGIPPKLHTAELTIVEYTVGNGTDADPIRAAWAFYAPNGEHLFSMDDTHVLAITCSPAAIVRPHMTIAA